MLTISIILVSIVLINHADGECTPSSDLKKESCATLTSTSPVVFDTPIWFTATLHNYKMSQNEELRFDFYDGLFEQVSITSNKTSVTWSILIEKNKYKRYKGNRMANVVIKKNIVLFWSEIDHAQSMFKITTSISGSLNIKQGNGTSLQRNIYIPTSNNTNFTAIIHDPHFFIMNHTQDVEFSWNFDSVNIGTCSTPSLITNVTVPGRYLIEVDVTVQINEQKPSILGVLSQLNSAVAFTTMPPSTNLLNTTNVIEANLARKRRSLLEEDETTNNPETTTTTTSKTTTTTTPKTTTTTTPKTTTTTTPKTTTTTTTRAPPIPPPPTPTPTPENYKCDGVWPGGQYMPYYGNTLSKFPRLLTSQNTNAVSSEKFLFGTFIKSIIAKDPIGRVSVSGRVWLHQGELLNLSISCDGTGEWTYCWDYREGSYNVTGEETCDEPIVMTNKCEFPINYYLAGKYYTMIIIVDNDVSHVVTPVGINRYKQVRQTALFIVILPVMMACLVFVFIALGIGLYVQRRRNYIVEVADFDFTESTADAEEALAGLSYFSHFKVSMRQIFHKDEQRPYTRMPQYIEQPRILDDGPI